MSHAGHVQPVCAVLRPGGPGGDTQLCVLRPGHRADCRFSPFSSWLTSVQHTLDATSASLPEWVRAVWEQVRLYEYQGLIDPTQETFQASPGRGQTRAWRQASREGADWRAPDASDRSIAPLPGKVPPGVGLIHAGSIGPRTKREGKGMSSAGELSAIAGAIKEQLDTARGLMEQASNILAEQEGEAARLLEGSAQEAAGVAISRMRSAQGSLDDALANSGIATEQIQQLIF